MCRKKILGDWFVYATKYNVFFNSQYSEVQLIIPTNSKCIGDKEGRKNDSTVKLWEIDVKKDRKECSW